MIKGKGERKRRRESTKGQDGKEQGTQGRRPWRLCPFVLLSCVTSDFLSACSLSLIPFSCDSELTLTPSWICRGVVASERMVPKSVDERLPFGAPKLVLFRTLKRLDTDFEARLADAQTEALVQAEIE